MNSKNPQNIIYCLADPTTSQIIYVGASTRGLRRAHEHMLSTSLKSNSKKNKAIKQILNAGLSPEIYVLEVLTYAQELPGAEIRWIRELKEAGHPLTNVAKGGNGHTAPHSAATKAHLRLVQPHGSGEARPIKCLETGVCYRTQREAAADIGRCQGTLCVALKTGGLCAGYHWEYLGSDVAANDNSTKAKQSA